MASRVRSSLSRCVPVFGRSWPALALFVVFILEVGLSCSPASAESNGSAWRPRIAIAAPLAGRHADLGREIMAGVEIALERAAVAGQDLSDVATILSEDDGCDAGRGEAAARNLARLRPDVVIGHPCAGAAIAAARIYAEAGVLFIATGVRHPALTDARAGPLVFRLAGRDDRQGEAAAKALAQMAPGGRIAIVHDRTAYARRILDGTADALKRRGLVLDAVVPIVAGRRSYDAEIVRLAAMRPEAILFAGYPAEAAVLLVGLRNAGLGAPLVATDAVATKEFANVISETLGEGAGVSVLVNAEPWRSLVDDDKALIPLPDRGSATAVLARAAVGVAAGPDLKTLADAGVTAWLAAARLGESRDAAAIGAALQGPQGLQTSAGALSFDEKGDARLDSFMPARLAAGQWSATGRPER